MMCYYPPKRLDGLKKAKKTGFCLRKASVLYRILTKPLIITFWHSSTRVFLQN